MRSCSMAPSLDASHSLFRKASFRIRFPLRFLHMNESSVFWTHSSPQNTMSMPGKGRRSLSSFRLSSYNFV